MPRLATPTIRCIVRLALTSTGTKRSICRSSGAFAWDLTSHTVPSAPAAKYALRLRFVFP